MLNLPAPRPQNLGWGLGTYAFVNSLWVAVDPTGYAVKRHNVGQQMHPQLSHSYEVPLRSKPCQAKSTSFCDEVTGKGTENKGGLWNGVLY